LQEGNPRIGALVKNTRGPENVRYGQINSGRRRRFVTGVGSKVEQAGDLVVLQKAGNQIRVVDIPLHKNKPGILIRPYQIASVASGVEVVDDNETFKSLRADEVSRESGSDEPGSPGE
tara:strand:- start:9866 stop:10219 length:354 start_codon:yes stop_codon:yes gene_type:complete